MTTDEENRERMMFGCLASDIDKQIVPFMGGSKMLAMSILSDAQELLNLGADESSRQHINRAKYLIDKFME